MVTRRTLIRSSGGGITAGIIGSAGCLSNITGGDTKQVDVAVTWWPSSYITPPWHVALENGYFQEEGFEIGEINASSGGGTTVRTLTTGGIPMAESAAAAPVKAWLAGAPIEIVSFGNRNPGAFVMAVPSDSDIESLQDMKGKSYGFTAPDSSTEAFGKITADRADGISVDDIEWQSMGGESEIITGMEEGIIDAGGVWDPTLAEKLIEDELRPIAWYPEYTTVPDTVIITGQEFAQENPDTVEGLLKARIKGAEFVRENPEEAAPIYAKGTQLSEEIALQVIENGNKYEFFNMEFTTEGIEDLEITIKTMGFDEVPPWEEIINQDYVPESHQAEFP